MALTVLLGGLAVATPNITLNNNVQMPILAFAANVWDAPTCMNATGEALKSGFSFIWSSFLVGADCQRAQRQALDAYTHDRASVFVAGTVDTQNCQGHSACYAATISGAQDQFSYLGPEPLDMLMLDYPSVGGCDSILGQWAALTSLYQKKQVRSIGVSNFEPTELGCLFPTNGAPVSVPPTVNQLRFYVTSAPGADVLALNAKHNINVQAYSPLGSGSVLQNPTVVQIAVAHGKSAAQVALRYIVQKNGTVATQSTKATHLREDVAIFGWTLTDAEMASLDKA